uniref:Alcohol dehydrogenase n=1 Tax=Meloidogyne incognita TaxID=6306 RepID=A0A914NJZ1_MELIC
MSTKNKIIKCKAAIAWEANKPLSIEEIEVSPPQKGEVRIKICYSAICHSDIYALESNKTNYPIILGHEAAGIVESVGEGVRDVVAGDYVIPSPLPQCRKCKICLNPNGNICEEFTFGNIRSEIMDDGKTRFNCKGKQIFHFVGLSTFSEYAVVREAAVCKINPKAPLDKVCLIGCGVTTGYGAPFNSCNVTKGSTVGVWGMGAIGLSIVLGCKAKGAEKIVGIDCNEERLKNAEKFGITDSLNPKNLTGDTKTFVDYIRKKYEGGFDFTFEATGNTKAMKEAIDCSKISVGQTCIIGVSDGDLCINAAELVCFGRTIRGCVVGGYKTRDAMPMLVEKYLKGELPLEKFIDWRFPLIQINEGIEHLKNSRGIRSVITVAGDNK